MTASEFTSTLESFYGWTVPERQRDAYLDRLQRFAVKDLDALAAAVIDNSKWFPKIAEILTIAQANGIWVKRDAARSGIHEWEPTDCTLCGGEGRLIVVYKVSFDPVRGAGDIEGRGGETHRLRATYPYSTPRGNIPYEDGDYQYVFRCFCVAAECATIPAWLPRWRK